VGGEKPYIGARYGIFCFKCKQPSHLVQPPIPVCKANFSARASYHLLPEHRDRMFVNEWVRLESVTDQGWMA